MDTSPRRPQAAAAAASAAPAAAASTPVPEVLPRAPPVRPAEAAAAAAAMAAWAAACTFATSLPLPPAEAPRPPALAIAAAAAPGANHAGAWCKTRRRHHGFTTRDATDTAFFARLRGTSRSSGELGQCSHKAGASVSDESKSPIVPAAKRPSSHHIHTYLRRPNRHSHEEDTG